MRTPGAPRSSRRSRGRRACKAPQASWPNQIDANEDRGQVLHADRGPNQNEDGDRELRRDGGSVGFRLGVDPGLGHKLLRKPHNLPPYVALGNLAYQPAVLLGKTGRPVLFEGDSDLVQPLNLYLGEGLAAGQRQQLGGKVDRVAVSYTHLPSPRD